MFCKCSTQSTQEPSTRVTSSYSCCFASRHISADIAITVQKEAGARDGCDLVRHGEDTTEHGGGVAHNRSEQANEAERYLRTGIIRFYRDQDRVTF